jgi:hypothetical protein
LRLKPGTEPVRALVEPFLWTWQFDAVDPKRVGLQSNWVTKLLDGKVTLRDLLDATQARYRDELHLPEPPAFLIYIDQGEELFVRAGDRERQRFSEILAQGLGDPRLWAMMSMGADFFGDLQKDEPCGSDCLGNRSAQSKPAGTSPALKKVFASSRFNLQRVTSAVDREEAGERRLPNLLIPLLG